MATTEKQEMKQMIADYACSIEALTRDLDALTEYQLDEIIDALFDAVVKIQNVKKISAA